MKKRASFRNLVDHCRSKELCMVSGGGGLRPILVRVFAKELGILSLWD